MGMLIQPVLRPVLQPVLRSIFDPGIGGGGGTPSLTAQVQALFSGGYVGGMWDATRRENVEGRHSAFPLDVPGALLLYQVLDSKEPLVPGPEMTPVTFDSPVGWTTSHPSVVIDGGTCTWTAAPTPAMVTALGGSALPTKALFLVEVTVDSITTGGLQVVGGQGAAQVKGLHVGVNSFVINTVGAAVPNNFAIYAYGPCNAVISRFSARLVSTAQSFLAQPSAALQPTWRDFPPTYAHFDGVDDALVATLPAMGSDCTVAHITPGGSPVILTGQTVAAGNYTVSANFSRRLVINRALTPAETATVTDWLNEP